MEGVEGEIEDELATLPLVLAATLVVLVRPAGMDMELILKGADRRPCCWWWWWWWWCGSG